MTEIGIDRHTLHKIFCVFNFVGKGRQRKNFNNEYFVIYGIYYLDHHCIPGMLILLLLICDTFRFPLKIFPDEPFKDSRVIL